MTEEIWKPVLGYEGLYEVSNLGEVRSVEREITYKDGRVSKRNGYLLKKMLNQKRENYQYWQVQLSRECVVRTFRVSHLVCSAFHGRRPQGSQCMHLDGNPQNDNADNLAWGTIEENSNEPIRRGRLSNVAKININNLWKRGVYGFELKPVIQYSIAGEFIAEYPSIREAEGATGIDHATISRACRGKLKTSGGYIWKHKEI